MIYPVNCIPINPYPWGSPWHDPELERLRRLERQAAQEAEKARIRERLRQMGVPDDQIDPLPRLPFPTVKMIALRPLTADDVVKQIK